MKRKFLALTLCFTILFSSINYKKSYANPALVMAPEAFNILAGMVVSAGVVLNAENIYTFIERTCLRVDSGVFSPYSSYEEFEEDLLKNTKKDKDPNGKEIFIINDDFFNNIKSFLDSSFENNSNNTVKHIYNPFGSVPVYISALPGNQTVVKNVSFTTTPSNTNSYKEGTFIFRPVKENAYSTSMYIDIYEGDSKILESIFYLYNDEFVDYRGFLVHNKYLNMSFSNSNRMPYKGSVAIKTEEDKYEGQYNSSNITNNIPVYNDISEGGNISFKPPTIVGEGNGDSDNGDSDNGDSDNGDSDNVFPGFPQFDFSGLDLSPISNLFEDFKSKFPFSVPFDIYNLLSVFVVEPKAPIFEVPIFTETIKFDLSIFEEWANIIRMFFVFGWTFILFKFSKKFGE